MHHRVYQVWAIALAAIGLVVLELAVACTPAQRDRAERILTMSADACVKIATLRGRTDIATYCGLSEDAVQVLSAALDEPVCTVPPADAGAEQ